MTYRNTCDSSADPFVRIRLSIVARIMSLFLREKVGRYSMTFSNVSAMMAISIFKKVSCEITTVMIKRK